jgi:hypothetical protein
MAIITKIHVNLQTSISSWWNWKHRSRSVRKRTERRRYVHGMLCETKPLALKVCGVQLCHQNSLERCSKAALLPAHCWLNGTTAMSEALATHIGVVDLFSRQRMLQVRCFMQGGGKVRSRCFYSNTCSNCLRASEHLLSSTLTPLDVSSGITLTQSRTCETWGFDHSRALASRVEEFNARQVAQSLWACGKMMAWEIAPEEEYDTPIHVECHNHGNPPGSKPKP